MSHQLPPTMKAITPLKIATLPVPTPDPTHHLVQVHACAITRSELTWPEAGSQSPHIPCHDISGTIISSPPNSLPPGTQVYAFLPNPGGAATYTTVAPDLLAPKPTNLTHEEAASIPLSALSAWQALVEHGGLREGQRVLVTGAAGGTGVMLVQIARALGAREVLGTGSARSKNLVEQMGATWVDYANESGAWGDRVGEVDVVVDCVGGETLRRCWGLVKLGGVLVSVAEDPAPLGGKEGVKGVYFVVRNDGEQLRRITALIEDGKIRPVVDSVMSLEEGAEAFEKVEGGRVKGKVVLRVG